MRPSDLGQLVTLDALSSEASVTRAARRLGLSTPAVSRALAKLRDRFDDPLLVRAGRGMVLTPRAEALRVNRIWVRCAACRALEDVSDDHRACSACGVELPERTAFW